MKNLLVTRLSKISGYGYRLNFQNSLGRGEIELSARQRFGGFGGFDGLALDPLTRWPHCPIAHQPISHRTRGVDGLGQRPALASDLHGPNWGKENCSAWDRKYYGPKINLVSHNRRIL